MPDHRFDNMAIVLPKSLRAPVLEEYHDNFGHRSADKTYRSIRKRFWWQCMKPDIANYIANCHKCASFNRATHKHRGFLHPVPLPDRPFAHVGLDFVGPRPKGKERLERSYLCATDYCTRYCIVEFFHSVNTKNVIKFLKDKIINVFGPIEVITCDAGSYFTSYEMKEFCEELHINLVTAYPHYQQANGLTERTIQSIERIMSKKLGKDLSNWQEELMPAVYAYNNTVNKTTGHTPAYLLFGHVADQAELNWMVQFVNDKDRIDIVNEIDAARTESKATAEKAQEAYKRQFDKNRKPQSLSDGNLCLKTYWPERSNTSGSYQPFWEGYFKVLSQEGNNFTVQSLRPRDQGKVLTFHASQLKPFTIAPVFSHFTDGFYAAGPSFSRVSRDIEESEFLHHSDAAYTEFCSYSRPETADFRFGSFGKEFQDSEAQPSKATSNDLSPRFAHSESAESNSEHPDRPDLPTDDTAAVTAAATAATFGSTEPKDTTESASPPSLPADSTPPEGGSRCPSPGGDDPPQPPASRRPKRRVPKRYSTTTILVGPEEPTAVKREPPTAVFKREPPTSVVQPKPP
jgi:hypothetical protein